MAAGTRAGEFVGRLPERDEIDLVDGPCGSAVAIGIGRRRSGVTGKSRDIFSDRRDGVGEFLHKHRNELGLAAAILFVTAVTAVFSDAYHTGEGRIEVARIIFRETAMLGIFALGAAIVIIAGGIDLSSGSLIAFSGTIFFGMLIILAPDDPSTRWAGDPERHFPDTENLSLWVAAAALLITLLIAFLVGSFHAWLITVIELPPFVATLASLVWAAEPRAAFDPGYDGDRIRTAPIDDYDQ